MFEVKIWLPAVEMYVLYDTFSTSREALDCLLVLMKGSIDCVYGGFVNA